MSVNFFCIGDPHFQNSNISDVEILIEDVISKTKEHQPDFVVIMGDILHEHEKISLIPFKKATEFIMELSEITSVYLLIGNHDYMNASQFLTNNHPFNSLKGLKNITIVDKVILETIQDKSAEFKFLFLPFVPNGRFIEALNGSGELWEMADCIFAHQEFKGCKMGAFISENGDEWDEDYPPVISGHIHEHQFVEPNIFYTGSILQHGWDDSSKKGIWHFTFESNEEGVSYTENLIHLNFKKKKLVKVDYEELKSLDINKYEKYDLKLDIKCHTEIFKKFKASKLYKTLISQNVKIAHTPIVLEKETLKNTKSLKSEKIEYLDIFRELCGAELKEEFEEVMKSL